MFVDTNVLVYARDASEPEKQARAADWMAALWEKRAGRLSYEVLQEFYVIVTIQLSPGLNKGLARRDVLTLCAWRPITADYRVLERAWLLQDQYRFSWRDALIVAAAKQSECQYLSSDDFHEGLTLGNLKVINPFHQRPEDVTW